MKQAVPVKMVPVKRHQLYGTLKIETKIRHQLYSKLKIIHEKRTIQQMKDGTR